MSGLAFKRLGELCVPQPKSKIKARAGAEAGKYKFFTSSNIQDKFYNEYQYNKPALIFGTGGNASVHYCGEPFSTSTDCIVLYAKDETVNLKAVYIYLQGNMHILENGFHGAGLKHISKAYLLNIPISTKTVDFQGEAVDAFDKLSGLIEKRTRQLEKLNLLVNTKFIETLEADKEVGTIRFGDACEFVRNGASIKQERGAGGYPITRIETLANGVFNTDRLGYANITDLSVYKNYLLKEGDILISHINSVAYLGRAVRYKGELSGPIIHGMNLLCARLKGNYNPAFFEWYFKTQQAKDYIFSITKKAVNQASITVTDLKKMPVPAVSKSYQDGFASFVERVDKAKTAIKQSLEKLETLKKALMQKYFG